MVSKQECSVLFRTFAVKARWKLQKMQRSILNIWNKSCIITTQTWSIHFWRFCEKVRWELHKHHHHHHHHYHHVLPLSLILSRHFSQSFIASGRSSVLHPVSSHASCIYVLAGRPPFARPYVEVHRSTFHFIGQVWFPYDQ